jgi:superfamily II DNA helicase RecQ
VVAYARATQCRQRLLTQHFGDQVGDDCGACDVCADPAGVAQQLAEASAARTASTAARDQAPALPLTEAEEASVVAFIDALKKPIGRRLVVRGLRGSRARDVQKKRLTENPHFAALKHCSDESIFASLDGLLEKGLLARTGKKYPTLWVAGKPVRPGWRAAAARPGGRLPSLERTLKNYRRAQARRRRIKPYQVFQDRTLLALCEARPRSEAELLDIWGLGEERVRKYGADLLALLSRTDPAGGSPAHS